LWPPELALVDHTRVDTNAGAAADSRQNGHNGRMRISAKVDYALRGLAELAALETENGRAVTRDQMAASQEIPIAFLENILLELKRGGIVRSVRGQQGGFRLARPADQITVADVIRTLEGPLASVRGMRPEELQYRGAASALPTVWVALRFRLREVLEGVTVADLVSGSLPPPITELADPPEAWQPR
jgi:Rrf2 family protein